MTRGAKEMLHRLRRTPSQEDTIRSPSGAPSQTKHAEWPDACDDKNSGRSTTVARRAIESAAENELKECLLEWPVGIR